MTQEYVCVDWVTSNVGDHVIFTVDEITDMGVYVRLVELGNRKGFIPINEISKKKGYKFNVKNDVAVITRIYGDNIDLSRKIVGVAEREAELEEYFYRQKIYSILRRYCIKDTIFDPELYHNIWDYLSKEQPEFKKDKSIDQVIDEIEEHTELSQDVLRYIKDHLAPPEKNYTRRFSMCYFGEDGIDTIRKILYAHRSSTCNIVYISAPVYEMTTKTEEEWNDVYSQIEKDILSVGGSILKNIIPQKDLCTDETF